jgi:hypothetical protein
MDEVKTGVDELMDLLRHEKRISIPDAAKRLKQTEKAVQNWVDFLVEERLLGIEYKFTTPFIYLNEPEKATAILKKKESIDDIKKLFLMRAKEKGIPQDKLKALWENHLVAAIDSRAAFFAQEAQKRNLGSSSAQVDALLHRYKEKVLKEYELRTSY